MIAATTKWKVAVYLAAIFAAGAVSGWVVAGRGAKKAVEPVPSPRSGPVFWKQSSVFQIGLTSAQTNLAKGIIEDYAKQMESTEKKHREFIRIASSNRNEELKKILNEEQRQQWDKLRKDREDAWRNRTNSWPGGTNGPKGWPPPGSWDKGERGERGERADHSRSNRDRRPPDRRDVTNAPSAQSPPSPAPPPR